MVQSTISNYFAKPNEKPKEFKPVKKKKKKKTGKKVKTEKIIDKENDKRVQEIIEEEDYCPKIREYISELSAKDKFALIIAYEELETSFNISKSIGYVKWLKVKGKDKGN